jgi:hypothetical protein
MNEISETKETGRAKRRGRTVPIIRLIALALPAVALSAAFALTASAAAAATAAITVNQVFEANSGAPPPGDVFTYTLTPKSGPYGAAETLEFTLPTGGKTGTASADIPLTFTGPGTYVYTLSCAPPQPGDGYTFDGRTYSVKVVAVENRLTGELPVAVNVFAGDDETFPKTAAVSFSHSYAGGGAETPDRPYNPGGPVIPADPAGPEGPAGPTDPGDTGGNADPAGPTPPPYTPSSPGGSYVLAGNGNYIELDGNGIPIGEWRYDPDGETWIFADYPPPTANLNLGGNLPQTGRLNWPVPVLAGFGALLFVAGWLCRRRAEDYDAGPAPPGLYFVGYRE